MTNNTGKQHKFLPYFLWMGLVFVSCQFGFQGNPCADWEDTGNRLALHLKRGLTEAKVSIERWDSLAFEANLESLKQVLEGMEFPAESCKQNKALVQSVGTLHQELTWLVQEMYPTMRPLFAQEMKPKEEEKLSEMLPQLETSSQKVEAYLASITQPQDEQVRRDSLE